MTCSKRTLFGLAVAAWLTASAGVARADELDKILASNAQDIVEHLTKTGHHNVAVLNFEVQTGGADGPVHPNLGRLSETMATRLENALILALEEDTKFGIIRGASRVAVEKDKAATYRTSEGRTKLFAHPYPMAWGGKTAKADAFLVGRVRFDSDMKKASVGLRCFDAKNPAEWNEIPLSDSLVAVTRQMLTDIDQPFVVPADAFRKRGDSDQTNPLDVLDFQVQPLTRPVAGQDKTPPKGVVPEVKTPKNPAPAPNANLGWIDSVVDFRAYYNESPVARLPDGNFPSPKPGQKVYFTIKTTERIGIVLLVNGINTADFEKNSKEVSGYTKWVLEPEKEYIIRGYYGNGKVLPFEVATMSEGQERLSELASPDRFGQIEMHLFKEIKGEVMLASTRGPILREEVAPTETLAQQKLKIKASMVASSKQVGKRSGLIVPGSEENAKLDSTEFESVLAAKVVISYTAKPLPKQ